MCGALVLMGYRSLREMKPLLYILLIIAGLICALNLMWLQFSSAKVVVGHRGVASVMVQIDDEVVELGNLRTGESRFFFLPKRGGSPESFFSVSYMIDEVQTQVCTVDIELTKRHVEVVLFNDKESTCVVSSPILSELIVTKFF